MSRAFFLQNNFTAGQVSPFIALRTDFKRHKNGLATLENMVVKPQGAVTSRQGFRYISRVKDSSKETHLIPFQVSETVSYLIEAGENYFRFYRDGEQIRLTSQAITNITQANPAVVSYNGADNYSNGDRVVISGVVGMTQVNNVEFTVANVNTGANTFELSGVDSTNYEAYTSGGIVEEIYEVSHTYSESDLENLRWTQSADVLFIFNENFPVKTLSRTSNTSWTFEEYEFLDGPYLEEKFSTKTKLDATLTVSAKTGTVTVTASDDVFSSSDTSGTGGTGTTDRIIRINNRRSPQSVITNITQADPPRVTSSNLDFANGDSIYVKNVSGMTEINNKTYEIDNLELSTSGNTAFFDLKDIDASGYTAYTSGGDISKLSDEWIWLKITGYTSATEVTAEIQNDGVFGDLGPYENWRLGAWSSTTGYPKVGTFHENRLLAAATTNNPDKIWASAIDGFNDFTPGTDDDNSWDITLLSNKLDGIQWMASRRQLRVGTVGSEYSITGGSGESSITPTSVNVKRDTTVGSIFAAPIDSQDATIFIGKAGKSAREFAYDFNRDSFVSPDLALIAEDIIEPRLSQIVFQEEPDGVVWARTSTGNLVGLTYLRDQDVIGWHKHPLGGTDAVVKSLAVVPGITQDELWAVVSRTVNSATVQSVEKLGDQFFKKDIKNAVILDSAYEFPTLSSNTVTGLNHLEGEEVSLLTDGGTHPKRTVTNGSITLDKTYTYVNVGLGYTQKLKTLKLEPGTPIGTSQGVISRVTTLVLKFFETVGAKFGTNGSDLKNLDFRTPSNLQDVGIPLFTGDKEIRPPGGYDRGLEVEIQQDEPLPMTLLGYTAKVEVSNAP